MGKQRDNRLLDLYLRGRVLECYKGLESNKIKAFFNNAPPETGSRTDAAPGLEGSIRQEFFGEMYNEGIDDEMKHNTSLSYGNYKREICDMCYFD